MSTSQSTWTVKWDENSQYPYGHLDECLGDFFVSGVELDCPDEGLDTLLGWIAREPALVRSAGGIADLLPDISVERIQERLASHPAFVALPAVEGSNLADAMGLSLV